MALRRSARASPLRRGLLAPSTYSSMQELLDYLNANGVMSRPFWIPMNQLPMYSNNLYINHSDVSASIHGTALSIPCSTNILESDLENVVSTIKMFFDR